MSGSLDLKALDLKALDLKACPARPSGSRKTMGSSADVKAK
jgi:hypothetical protein